MGVGYKVSHGMTHRASCRDDFLSRSSSPSEAPASEAPPSDSGSEAPPVEAHSSEDSFSEAATRIEAPPLGAHAVEAPP